MLARRDFLKAAVAAGALLPLPAHATGARQPWRLGFDNPPKPDLAATAEVTGRLPADLAGTFYRIGPAQHERAGRRYDHWFDGDGMAQAWQIADGRVTHCARMVQTPKYQAETRAGRFLYPAFGTRFDGMRPADSPNAINAANINLISHGGRLLALWEGGEAFELAPDDLESRGFWSVADETRNAPFSAHPRVEPDGTLWNFGAAQWAGKLILYRIDANGVAAKLGVLDMPQRSMVHDFIVTARHIVVVFPSLVLEDGDGSFLDRHRFRPDLPMAALVIDKNDFTVVRRHDLPPGFVFHYGNGWEEDDGTIRFDACLYENADLVFGALRHVMSGKAVPASPSQSTLVTLRPDGGIDLQALCGGIEFPRVDPRVIGGRHRTVYAASGALGEERAEHPLLSAVVRCDIDTGATARFAFEPTQMVEEHVFVPRPGGSAEDDGWLIGTALDIAERRTRLQVFDAARIADGPLAVARLPYALPLGLHGSFKPA